MLSRSLPVMLALVAGACQAARPWGAGVDFETQLSAGYSAVSHEAFEGHSVYGVEFATTDSKNGWGYELGGRYGAEDQDLDGTQREGEFNELALGVRRVWGGEDERRTMVGFGGALTQIENILRGPTRTFEEEGGGAYAHVGMQWPLGVATFDPGTRFSVGFDLRGFAGDDYEYAQLALVLGFTR